MAFDIGQHFPGLAGSVPKPQHSYPTTNLGPHVDGGPGPAVGAAGNAAASADECQVRNYAVAMVLVALALLWLMGAFAFRGLRL